MGGIPYIPRITRCCFCTRKLKVACILIVIWSMLATTHSTRILFCPACPDLYDIEGGIHYEGITVISWALFIFNMVTLCSAFAFLLGIFWGYRYTADVFMFSGFVTAVTMVLHAIANIFQIIDIYDELDENEEPKCTNPSDVIAHFIYFLLWCYFILIVNTHRDSIFLPSVKSCCFIIQLIDGCYFAGIYGVFSILDFTFGLLSNQPEDCWGRNSTMPRTLQYYGYFMTILCLLVGIISVIFIWGLRKTKSYTAVWFMYAMSFKMLCLFLFTILLVVANLKYFYYEESTHNLMNCHFPWFTITFALIFTFVHGYLVLIVRSYHSTMVLHEEEQAAAEAAAALVQKPPPSTSKIISSPRLSASSRSSPDVKKSIMKQPQQC